MKKLMLNSILVLAFASVVDAAPTADAWPQTGLKASIPFAFTVKGVALPPGEYQFTPPTASGVVSITDSVGRRVMVLTNPMAPPRLRFEKRASGYVLMNW